MLIVAGMVSHLVWPCPIRDDAARLWIVGLKVSNVETEQNRVAVGYNALYAYLSRTNWYFFLIHFIIMRVTRLLTLKPVAREFQGAAVLRDGTDDIVWYPIRDLRVDFQRDPD